MMDQQKKLETLAVIARALRRKRVLWAVGGSLLLYLKGVAGDFNDLDLMVASRDIQKAKDALLTLGVLRPARHDPKYQSGHFYEFEIDGVDVDVIAEFTILSDGRRYCFPLEEGDVAEYAEVFNEKIPLQSLTAWREIYELMGRTGRVGMIDQWAGQGLTTAK